MTLSLTPDEAKMLVEALEKSGVDHPPILMERLKFLAAVEP